MLSFSDEDYIESIPNNSKYAVTYNDTTMETYRVMREINMDPILFDIVNKSIAFKYPYMWNPFTGEKTGIDPYGPLTFHPDSLIHYIYESRLNGLWIEPVDNDDNSHFEGYYGAAVGAGQDIFIKSRGSHPERYLFRLPIIDCYWDKNFSNYSVVTMGPILTNEEIELIDKLGNKAGDYYYRTFGRDRPSLKEIKFWYDMAINKNPVINKEFLTEQQKIEERNRINRFAVDKLISL